MVDFESPFEAGVEGFNERWWQCWTSAIDNDAEYVKLLSDGVEVARAQIDEWETPETYVGLEAGQTVREIVFIEVRNNYRRQGLGAELARRIGEHYRGQLVTAFAEGEAAFSFWCSIGWTWHRRFDEEDGDNGEDGAYRPLFAKRYL